MGFFLNVYFGLLFIFLKYIGDKAILKRAGCTALLHSYENA
jgi:hypothetical protein